MASGRLYAGIDAGGTTFKLGVADEAGRLCAKTRVPTDDPQSTVAEAVVQLKRLAEEADGAIVAVGIASFGPVDVDPGSPNYGTILKTPKPGWSGARLRSRFAEALGAPVTLDTDVNAALLAELATGAACGAARAAYVTIGTGVGVGVQIDGRFAGRPFHPELGHIRVERQKADAGFAGECRIHGACLEGLVSAPALIARYGALEALPDDHPCWSLAGWHLAQLCLTLSLGWRVQRIVLGGGVMNAPSLLDRVREAYAALANDYIAEASAPHRLIVKAALGDDAGLLGAVELVRRAEPALTSDR